MHGPVNALTHSRYALPPAQLAVALIMMTICATPLLQSQTSYAAARCWHAALGSAASAGGANQSSLVCDTLQMLSYAARSDLQSADGSKLLSVSVAASLCPAWAWSSGLLAPSRLRKEDIFHLTGARPLPFPRTQTKSPLTVRPYPHPQATACLSPWTPGPPTPTRPRPTC